MTWDAGPPYSGERAVLATMHGKERIIAPLALRFLGLHVEPALASQSLTHNDIV